MRRKIFFNWARNFYLCLCFALLSMVVTSCESFAFVDDSQGRVEMSIGYVPENKAIGQTGADAQTKAVARDFPDSNAFLMTVTSSGGETVYDGKYGLRPKDFNLNTGTYSVFIRSHTFTTPEFSRPVYADNRTFVVEGGKSTKVALVCKQINCGLRVTFSSAFKTKFSGSVLKISDSKGSANFPFEETRFVYLNPGIISLVMRRLISPYDETKISDLSLTANEMLSLNIDYSGGDGQTGTKSGIVIDTASVWGKSEIVFGEISGGDGSSKLKAMSVEQAKANIGAKGVWVVGYIAGGDLTQSALKFEPPFTSESNLAIVTLAGSRDRSKCLAVSLPTGAIRDAVNLKLNPGNLGKKIWFKGTIVADYFNLPGINTITEYSF